MGLLVLRVLSDSLKLLLLVRIKVDLVVLIGGHRGLWPLIIGYRYEGNDGKSPAYLLLELRRLTQEVGGGDRRLEWHRILGMSNLCLSLYRDGCRLGLLRRLLGLNGGRLLLSRGRLGLRLWLRLG